MQVNVKSSTHPCSKTDKSKARVRVKTRMRTGTEDFNDVHAQAKAKAIKLGSNGRRQTFIFMTNRRDRLQLNSVLVFWLQNPARHGSNLQFACAD